MNYLVAAIPAGAAWAVSSALGAPVFGSESFASLAAAVPAVWTFWSVADRLHAKEYAFLHPQVYKYNLSKRQVFDTVLEYLGERSIKYGRPWIQQSVDPDRKNKIVYHIAWTEEKIEYNFDLRAGLRERQRNVKLWVQLHMYIEPQSTGSTAVQISWRYQAESLPEECKYLIAATTLEIQNLLGPGIPLPTVLQREHLPITMPTYATALIALFMVPSLCNSVFPDHLNRISQAEQSLADARARSSSAQSAQTETPPAKPGSAGGSPAYKLPSSLITATTEPDLGAPASSRQNETPPANATPSTPTDVPTTPNDGFFGVKQQ